MEETLINLIGNVGFPVFAAAWLLVRIDPVLKAMYSQLNSNAEILKEIATELRQKNGT